MQIVKVLFDLKCQQSLHSYFYFCFCFYFYYCYYCCCLCNHQYIQIVTVVGVVCIFVYYDQFVVYYSRFSYFYSLLAGDLLFYSENWVLVYVVYVVVVADVVSAVMNEFYFLIWIYFQQVMNHSVTVLRQTLHNRLIDHLQQTFYQLH